MRLSRAVSRGGLIKPSPVITVDAGQIFELGAVENIGNCSPEQSRDQIDDLGRLPVTTACLKLYKVLGPVTEAGRPQAAT